MQELTLDLSGAVTREDLHRICAETLSLPEWYGGNLDALYDCLTDLHRPLTLRLRGVRAMTDALGGYGRRVLKVLFDAEQESEGDLKIIL